MARKSGKSIRGPQISDGLVPTAVLSCCFLASGIAGCLVAAAAGDAAVSSLALYLQNYLQLLAEDGAVSPSVWETIWELCRWPALVFLLGFTALGAVVIPAVFCVRGFLLAYAIASFVRVFGGGGLQLALVVFGMTAFVSVPVLFGIGSVMFPISLGLAVGAFGERQSGPKLKESVFKLVPCGAMITFAVFFQWAVMPQILSALSHLVTIT